MKVHVHDNSRVPAEQDCLAEYELREDKIITLHMHDGECVLCPEGHCHYGSIALAYTEKRGGHLFVTFEGIVPPARITQDDYRPQAEISH